MADRGREPGVAPEIELIQVSAEREEALNRWAIAWLVKNPGKFPLRILSVRMPHGQFKSEEQRFEPPIDLEPGETTTQINTAVRCEEPPGPVTENAFVIFYVIWLEEPWRIFVRIRVVINLEGKPQTMTELTTTQKVGSGQADWSR